MVFKAKQIVRVKSLGWFDENSSDNHLVEEHFILDRDFFEKLQTKTLKYLMWITEIIPYMLNTKTLMVSTHMYGSQCEVLKTKVEEEES